MTRPGLRLRVLPAAISEITEQAAYYREKSGEPLAQRWRTSVNDAIRSLRELPERGKPSNFDTPTLSNIRSLHIEGFPRHLLFYRFESNTGIVSIISVLHGARDLETVVSLDIRS
jgi:plasmid stabilization system protein ParE